MKFPPAFLGLIISLGALTATAQLPSTGASALAPASSAPIQHSLMLDVQTKSSGGGIKTTGNQPLTSAGTNTQTRDHTTTLEVTIRSFDKAADQVLIEWYFFGKPIANPRANDSVFDSGNKTVTVQAAGVETFDIASKVAQTAKVTKTAVQMVNSYNPNTGGTTQVPSYSASESQTGTKLVGWVVRMTVDGKVLDVRGSDSKYEDMLKSPDKFNALNGGK
jgi:hypothetical protein